MIKKNTEESKVVSEPKEKRERVKEAESPMPGKSVDKAPSIYRIPKILADKPLEVHISKEEQDFFRVEKKPKQELPTIKLEGKSFSSDMAKLKDFVKKVKPFDVEKLEQFEVKMTPCHFFNLDKCRHTNVQKHSVNAGSCSIVAHICCVCHWSANACEFHSARDCPMVKLRQR